MAIRPHYILVADGPDGTTAEILDLAENLIEQYVGPQDKFIKNTYQGEITSLPGDKTIVDLSFLTLLHSFGQVDFFKGCIIEFLTGARAGDTDVITASIGTDASVQYSTDTDQALAVGDIFKIYQFLKFPRCKDVINRYTTYYKAFPIAVKDAVYAQIEFIMEMGEDYFTGDEPSANNESIGNYSYQSDRVGSPASTVKMVSPKARALLRGIMNRKGTIEVD